MRDSLGELDILIVDDDSFLINLTKRILKQLGIEKTRGASDGAAALACLDESPFEVVICDLNMPGMDGLEFLRHLAGREVQPAVILLSGEDKAVLKTAEQLGRAYKLRILGALSKPIQKEPLEKLLGKIESSHGGGAAFSVEMLTPDEIRQGLENGAVRLVYQPKVAIAERVMVGVEALVRWQDPKRGLLGPGALIPVAEESGLINPLTDAIFKVAMAQCGAWLAEGLDFKVSVNVSIENLDQLDFPDFVVDTAAQEGVPPSSVILEVTESRVMADILKPLEILTRLRMKGVGLSIDDYGTGASSMQQIKRIPFTELKIDREFVAGAPLDDQSRAMLISSIGLGKDLGLTIVAEGVETQEEWDLVAALGVDIVQGYFVAKPMPGEEIAAWRAGWLGDKDGGDTPRIVAAHSRADEPGEEPVLPAKPSIAVLPFTNMSAEFAQGSFADGMTEDIITDLARFNELFVIARHSTLTYKDRAVKVQDVSRELGVSHVLEGSIRVANDRVRITAQLIDARTGEHQWAERYDRDVNDVFAVQDEISQKIVTLLAGKLSRAALELARRKPPNSLEAYDYTIRGWDHLWRTQSENLTARALFDEAIARDPGYARSHAGRSKTYFFDWQFQWTDDTEGAFFLALDEARSAVALDPDDCVPRLVLADVLVQSGSREEGLAELDVALALNPNNADAWVQRADALTLEGLPEEAIAEIRKALRLNPHHPDWYLWQLGFAHYLAREYDEAIAALRKMSRSLEANRLVAASLAQIGLIDEARVVAAEFLEVNPSFSAAYWGSANPFRNDTDLQHFIDGYLKAGLPM